MLSEVSEVVLSWTGLASLAVAAAMAAGVALMIATIWRDARFGAVGAPVLAAAAGAATAALMRLMGAGRIERLDELALGAAPNSAPLTALVAAGAGVGFVVAMALGLTGRDWRRTRARVRARASERAQNARGTETVSEEGPTVAPSVEASAAGKGDRGAVGSNESVAHGEEPAARVRAADKA